jgi:hypothetical protein
VDVMGGVYSTHGENRYAYKDWMEKLNLIFDKFVTCNWVAVVQYSTHLHKQYIEQHNKNIIYKIEHT